MFKPLLCLFISEERAQSLITRHGALIADHVELGKSERLSITE